MRRRLFFFTILLLSTLVLSCELLLEKPAKPKIHALFISLDYYDSASPASVSPLPATLIDAKEMMAALDSLANEFSIEIEFSVLLDGEHDRSGDPAKRPNKLNIQAHIESYATMGEEDIFLLFYSGHGDENGNSLIVLQNTLGESGQTYDVVTSGDLVEWLSVIPARKLIILDTCFSGYVVPEYPRSVQSRETSQTPLYDPSAFYLTASSANQESHEAYFSDIGQNHGYFSRYLLEALGWNHDIELETSIEADGKTYVVKGGLYPQSYWPNYHGGSIMVGDLFAYITNKFWLKEGWISFQRPQTGKGPLDLVLFSDRW